MQPIALDDPLPVSTPDDVGMDMGYLSRVIQHLREDTEHDVHSMLIARGGQLVVEEYFNGFGRDNPHDLRSATKSITSLLTGIAIDQEVVTGLDMRIMDALGESYPDVADKDAITIRHLLSMSSGLDCDDGDRGTKGQEDRMYHSKDWIDYFLSLNSIHEPGTVTRYCTGGVVALGEVIARSANQDIDLFARKNLFDPMGIQNLQWARFDDGDKVDTGGHLLLTPQAMVKLGLLVLQEGQWEGRQLVAAEWIAASTKPETIMSGQPYGFLWWRNTLRFLQPDSQSGLPREVDVISARGNGGQVIFVVPEFELVVVFTAGYYNSDDTQIVYDVFRNAVLTSMPGMGPFIPGPS